MLIASAGNASVDSTPSDGTQREIGKFRQEAFFTRWLVSYEEEEEAEKEREYGVRCVASKATQANLTST